MPDFARLEPQNVRDHWEHEATKFTPWLADEIELEGTSDLEDVLGLDLEVIEREKPVGKYSVDIFARVIDDGRTVIIEN
jgi:aromatic ring-opening dioxygenase LigB subunit